MRLILLVLFFLVCVPLNAIACSGQLRVELEHTGVYMLDHDTIAAAQPGLAECPAEALQLTWRGEPVPMRVVNGDDGQFGPGSRIEWIGSQLHGPMSWFNSHSTHNAYLLLAVDGAAARISEGPAPVPGMAVPLLRVSHMEEENLMVRLDETQQKPGEEVDVWMWAKMTHVDPEPFVTSFDLPDLDRTAGSVKLDIGLRGLSAIRPPHEHRDAQRPEDHAVDIHINGEYLETLSWNGRDAVERTLEIPAAVLRAADNELTLGVPRRSLPWDDQLDVIDVVMFNWMRWEFPLRGDLDAGLQPLQVDGDGTESIRLHYSGAGTPVLYGEDGIRRPGTPDGAGQYLFAGAPSGTVLHPVIDGLLASPDETRAAAAADWWQPGEHYDYLIVSHPRFIEAVRPLAEFHESRGLRVALLDVNDVYDTFHHGIVHPQAIRNLVDRAWHHWPQPRPRFLLLVGNASFDIRNDTHNDQRYAKWAQAELLYPNHFGAIASTPYENLPESLANRNLIPTWQFPSSEGQSASDNPFASVADDDWRPVLAVGRFPVFEPEEVTAIVDKTIKYMTTPRVGAWRRDVMFITDEIDYFKSASDKIASEINMRGFAADKVYASPEQGDNAQHQSNIRDGINDGRLLVHFIGHGGRYIWRTGPPDLNANHDLFTLDDVASLDNSDNLPMILSMTCYSAPFDNPTEDSIGERFLREPDKGAVAVFAASWRNFPSPTFSANIIRELLEPGQTIGDAIVRAKAVENSRVMVEMYNLLGDPAVVLERPGDQALIQMDDNRWQPGLLVDLQDPMFAGQVSIDWMDGKGQVLSSHTLHADSSRFRLPIPTGSTEEIDQVRVYSTNPLTGRDSVGALDLRAQREREVPPHPLTAAWQGASRTVSRWLNPPRQRPLTVDTLHRSSFDGRDQNLAEQLQKLQHEHASAGSSE